MRDLFLLLAPVAIVVYFAVNAAQFMALIDWAIRMFQ